EYYTAMSETMGPAPRAHYALGMLWEKNGKFRDAIEQYRDALGRGPWTYLDPWFAMAGCYMKAEDYASAFQNYVQMLTSQVVTLSKEQMQVAYNNMGMCMLLKGDHEGAMRKWRECLSINPQNPDAHFDLAMMFDQESHITSAIDEYKLFLRCAPLDMKAQ